MENCIYCEQGITGFSYGFKQGITCENCMSIGKLNQEMILKNESYKDLTQPPKSGK